jgi:hypothetical protein
MLIQRTAGCRDGAHRKRLDRVAQLRGIRVERLRTVARDGAAEETVFPVFCAA